LRYNLKIKTMKRKITNSILASVVAISTCSTGLYAQNVTIPDANFKAYLVGNAAVNTNSDSEIQMSEAVAFTGTLDCGGLSISSLTGIEAFTNLTGLFCNNNLLSSIDVSSNISLLGLRCQYNQITTLDLSSNNALVALKCNHNQLTSLNTSNLSNLYFLECNGNEITSLDLSSNPALEHLDCADNELTALNVGTNTSLYYLVCFVNSISILDLSSNTALEYLECGANPIVSLNLSANYSLDQLYCGSPQLTSLNLQNGANTNISYIGIGRSPNLSCIQVDDVAYSTSNWTNIGSATFSTNCNLFLNVEIVDDIKYDIYPNPSSTITTLSGLTNGQSLKVIDITGKVVFQTVVNSSTLDFDVTILENGVYIIQVEQNGAVAQKKLVVNK